MKLWKSKKSNGSAAAAGGGGTSTSCVPGKFANKSQQQQQQHNQNNNANNHNEDKSTTASTSSTTTISGNWMDVLLRAPENIILRNVQFAECSESSVFVSRDLEIILNIFTFRSIIHIFKMT